MHLKGDWKLREHKYRKLFPIVPSCQKFIHQTMTYLDVLTILIMSEKSQLCFNEILTKQTEFPLSAEFL